MWPSHSPMNLTGLLHRRAQTWGVDWQPGRWCPRQKHQRLLQLQLLQLTRLLLQRCGGGLVAPLPAQNAVRHSLPATWQQHPRSREGEPVRVRLPKHRSMLPTRRDREATSSCVRLQSGRGPLDGCPLLRRRGAPQSLGLVRGPTSSLAADLLTSSRGRKM